jgi:hypothetical protein
MATRKMTFTLPEGLARLFFSRVSLLRRSKYLAGALRDKLSAEDRLLLEGCRAANRDPDVRAIETEFDRIIV